MSLICIMTSFLMSSAYGKLSDEFVYLYDVDPTILSSICYAGAENFVGKSIPGYGASVAILTREAANALKNVQADIAQDGYSLVVYEAYRPQQASNYFVQWSKTFDEATKSIYYPRTAKTDLFTKGYMG